MQYLARSVFLRKWREFRITTRNYGMEYARTQASSRLARKAMRRL